MGELKTQSGKSLHPIGIGTWGFGGTWEAVYGNEAAEAEAIRYSISVGQNHIDSGEIYGAGHTDEIIGQAIAGLKRQELFITDKIWETHVAKGKVRPAVEIMLKKLGTDYLDLLYIHKPWDDFPWREAVPQICELINEGIVKHFGVSNFNVTQMKEAQALSSYPIAANQLHHNVIYRQDVDDSMRDYCLENQVKIIAYRPLERGEALKNDDVVKLAKAKGITPSQVALAWLINQDMYAIPQSSDKKMIDENVLAAKVKLTKQEMDLLG